MDGKDMKPIQVGLLGIGTVGSGVFSVLRRNQAEIRRRAGRGIEIVLYVDQSGLAGQSTLLLSALLSRLFARHAGINGFVRTRTRLVQKQEDVSWPMTPGNRYLI